MEKDKGSSKCSSTSHRHLMDNAKNRLNDLQGRFSDLQAARMEGRQRDVVVLEEQVCQSIREWKTELDAPTPASSLLAGASLGSFSDELNRFLQLYDEEDDATSALAQPSFMEHPHGTLQNNESLHLGHLTAYHDDFLLGADPLKQDFHELDGSFSDVFGNMEAKPADLSSFLDTEQFILADDSHGYGLPIDNNVNEGFQKNTELNSSSYVSPPPSAFMGPKCALWDCTRPAQGSASYKDYCSSFHYDVAVNEGRSGMTPIVQPGGIGVKDNVLFDALTARTQGKDVGIPQCEGAASARSPWNAPELFDTSLLTEKTVLEWLFFDEPRKAYDSGSRKQRSLPDYKGRGWHESRKQLMELGCQKRSYYMDPQPSSDHEWHLFEYQVKNSDALCALYKLELKKVEGKKTPRGRVSKASLADLQMKMDRLTADGTPDNSPNNVAKSNGKGDSGALVLHTPDQKTVS